MTRRSTLLLLLTLVGLANCTTNKDEDATPSSFRVELKYEAVGISPALGATVRLDSGEQHDLLGTFSMSVAGTTIQPIGSFPPQQALRAVLVIPGYDQPGAARFAPGGYLKATVLANGKDVGVISLNEASYAQPWQQGKDPRTNENILIGSVSIIL